MGNIKRYFSMTSVAVIVISISLVVIAFARGYKFSPSTKSLKPQGIIVAHSSPNNAEIYINGEMRGLTDKTVYLSPGTYNVVIRKEGYTQWKKTYILEKEEVYKTDTLLFLLNPALSPLTNRGLLQPALFANGKKVVYIKQPNEKNLPIIQANEEKSGIFFASIDSQTLNIFKNKKLILPFSQLPFGADLSKTAFIISPNEKNIMAVFYNNNDTILNVYLLSVNDKAAYLDITLSYQTILERWNEQDIELRNKVIESQNTKIRSVFQNSAYIIQLSPDKKKILYFATQSATLPRVINPPLKGSSPIKEHRNVQIGKYYVYDIKEDKNYYLPILQKSGLKISKKLLGLINSPDISIDNILNKRSLFRNIFWYSNNHHIVLMGSDTISVMEYDGQNKVIVYSGPFNNLLSTVTKDGKIILLTNLNPKRNKLPDLYAISIK